MRLAVVIISLLSTAAGAAAAEATTNDERDLQVVACPANIDPVRCGLSATEFDNQCLANAAGFTPSRCYPFLCTATDTNTACTRESNPVVCGILPCQYDNYCLAEAAGFPPTACYAVNCPGPEGEVACTLEYDPFVCLVEGVGLCDYSNSCGVSSSGLDPEGPNCVRQINIPANDVSVCPIVTGSAAECPFEYDPQRCLGQCLYTNMCEANDAFSAAGQDATANCQSANCALPDPEVVCTAESNPQICYPEGCTYSNPCQAMAAGYLESSCIAASCPQPPADTMCTREYDPQLCDGGCKYDNSCISTAAGATNCVPEVDPTNPPGDVCPVPDATVACTTDVNEVLCGDDNCFYPNPCTAGAAGFNAGLDCRSLNCPPSAATVADCGDFGTDAVLCGPYQCPYLSLCVANRARWVSAECTPAACPQPAADTICTLEYTPFICFDETVYAGASCVYSNGCLAQAAGYDPSPYAGQCVEPLVATQTRSATLGMADGDAVMPPPPEGETPPAGGEPAESPAGEPAAATDAPAAEPAAADPTPSPGSGAIESKTTTGIMMAATTTLLAYSFMA